MNHIKGSTGGATTPLFRDISELLIELHTPCVILLFLSYIILHDTQSSSKKRGTIRNKIKVTKGKKRGKSNSKKSTTKSAKN